MLGRFRLECSHTLEPFDRVAVLGVARGWRRTQILRAVLCLCCVWIWARPLAAQVTTASGKSQRQLRLSFSAPAGCPDATRFTTSVRDKTQVVDWSSDPTSGEVRVVVEPGGTRGSVEMRQPANETLERSVEAPNCADLVDALAFVLVVALDPSAARGRQEPPGPNATPTVVAPKRPVLPSAQTAGPTAVRNARGSSRTPKLEQQIWSLSLATALETGLTSRPGVAIELGTAAWFVGDHSLETRTLRRLTTRLAWAPEVGAQLGWLRGTSSSDGVELRLNRFAARGFACPFFVGLAPRILLAPCLDTQVGRVVTTTEGLVQAGSKNLAWLTFGARAQVSARWPRIWVGLSAGAETNVWPHKFTFMDGPGSGETLFARTPRWSGIVALTVSVPILRSEL